MLHIAYGPNINPLFMRRSCPYANYVDEGILQGYRLAFRKDNGNCFITIEETQRASDFVPIYLWSISDGEERALDQYVDTLEAFHKERAIATCSGRKQTGFLYTMDFGAPAIPSSDYFQCIQRGYYYAGIDPLLLHGALRRVNRQKYDAAKRIVLENMYLNKR